MRAHHEVVGRHEELRAVEEFLAGPAGALLLEGEAGIGKTTLWQRGVELAAPRAYRVLTTMPAAAETQLAFAGLRDLLDELYPELESELPVPQRDALAVALLREDSPSDPPRQEAVAAGFLGVLRAATRSAPVLLAIDDIQWLDASSALVLGFAVRRLRDEPVFLVLTLRAGHNAPGFDLERFPEDKLTRLTVGPLSVGALNQMLVSRLVNPLPRPTLRAVHDLSRGNPFYALEIARALPGSRWTPPVGEPLPVPSTLAGLVATRIAGLPAGTRDALAVAAALANPTLDVIEAVSGRVGARVLESAVDEGVVVVDDGRVRFTHPLFAAAAYEQVAISRRRRIHAAVAAVLERQEERARHLALASLGPDENVAAELELAAHTAFTRGAPPAAVDLCDQARTLTPAGHPESRRRRTLAQVEYCLRAGESGRARDLLEGLLADSPSGPGRAEVLAYLGWAELFGLDWQRSHRFYAEALAEPGASDLVRAKSELGIASVLLLLRQDMEGAAEHARAAVCLAERLQDPALLARALATQAGNEFLLGAPASSRELIELALSLDADLWTTPVAEVPQSWHALILSWTDELQASRATWETMRAHAVERGDETSLAWILARMALVECVAGSFRDAKGHLEDAHEIVTLAGQESNRAVVLAARALVEAHLGDIAAARAAGEEALDVAAEVKATFAERIARAALGFLALSLQSHEEAHAYFEGLINEDRAASIREPSEFRFLPDDIEALTALGRLEEAEDALTYLDACAQATGRTSATAAALRCRALLAAARRNLSQGIDAAREAVAVHARVELPLEHARSLLVLGILYRRAKQWRAARESFEAALAIFERLGARVWAERARAELARIGGRRAQGDELTETEQRVVELVAEGRTNREVAAALFVTPKTVEFHLRHIYSKLGVRTRTELASRVAAQVAVKD